jgi:hypothetical protein
MKTAPRTLLELVSRTIAYVTARCSLETRVRRQFMRLATGLILVESLPEQVPDQLKQFPSVSRILKELHQFEYHMLVFVNECSSGQNWRSLRRHLRAANQNAKPLLKLHKLLSPKPIESGVAVTDYSRFVDCVLQSIGWLAQHGTPREKRHFQQLAMFLYRDR